MGKLGIIDLKAVIHSHGVAALGLARGCGERQSSEKRYIVLAERTWEEGSENDDFVLHQRLEREVHYG